MDGEAVTLEDVLVNRERRVRRRHAALSNFHRPVLTVSLVLPGPLKDFAETRILMDEAVRALDEIAKERGWPVLDLQLYPAATGPEAILVIDAEAAALKRAAVALEERHTLGRLWDMDVVDAGGDPISRRALGLQPRRCLICEEEAHACARSRAHPVPELLEIVKEKVRAFSMR